MMRCLRISLAAVVASSSLMVGCPSAPSAPAPSPVTLLSTVDPAAAQLVEYLQQHHAVVSRSADGESLVVPGPGTRAALIAYMRIARLRLDICAANIANINTTRDEQGKPSPFRRRFVTLSADGSCNVETDPSPFITRYLPGHPDADAKGYVAFPNVDMSIEQVNCAVASQGYSLAAETLRRLEPGIVMTPPLASGADGVP